MFRRSSEKPSVTSQQVTCAHCRAPLSTVSDTEATGSTARPTAEHFCCTGCRSARSLIDRMGLGQFYDLSNDVSRGDAEASERPWLPALLDLARVRHPESRLVLTLDVQGLHCAACVWVLQALFRKRQGAVHLEVDPGVGRLHLTFDARSFALAAYLDDIAQLGYRVGPPCREGRPPSDGLGLRLGVTIAIAMNAMALTFATYLGLGPDDPDGLYTLFGWVNLALSTAALLVAGPVFIRGAIAAARRGALHLDVPIALGVVLAYVGSVVLFFSGRPELAYFDTLDIFLALMMLGRWAQRRFLDVNRRRLLDDDGFVHVRVKVIGADGTIAHRPLAELAADMRFLVAPRELVPVAANVEGAPTQLDLAWISGESEPVTVHPADIVPAGAHLASDAARVFVAREAFAASALHDLLRTSDKDDTGDRFWHRFTAAWVIAVLAFASIVAVVWAASSPLDALRHATAVLVVTCPCAIGLATPLAYELAHMRLRKHGLLPRRPGLLDRARRIRHVVFDKTGTLTLTRLDLDEASLHALDTLAPADRDALYQLSARSNHPKSRAIQAALAARPLDTSLSVTETPGLGLASLSHTLFGDGVALVLARADDAHALVRLTFTETLRPQAKAEIAALIAAGLDVHIASGDSAERAAAVAQTLGIAESNVHARMSPADKAALVTTLGAGETLFVGDGVNDALAFERAAIAGTPVLDRPTLPARADFVVTSGHLGPVAELLRLSQRVRTITLRNVAIAAVYNALALVAGIQGWLSPVVAALAMPASSLLVLALTTFSSRERRPAATAPAPSTKGSAPWMPSTSPSS